MNVKGELLLKSKLRWRFTIIEQFVIYKLQFEALALTPTIYMYILPERSLKELSNDV